MTRILGEYLIDEGLLKRASVGSQMRVALTHLGVKKAEALSTQDKSTSTEFEPPQEIKSKTRTEHIFISYVREDDEVVERLSADLRQSNIVVWLDRDDIPPGSRWKRVIKRAISEGGHFLACFSSNYSARNMTYMNEELLLAIELLRQMPVDRYWFIPILLDECEVPDLEIGRNETLRDIQQVHLYRDWNAGIKDVLSVLSGSERDIAQGAQSNSTTNQGSELEVAHNSSDLGHHSYIALFLAANPVDTARLRLSEELREIQRGIISSRSKDQFRFEVNMATRPRDILESILRVQPRIVHFSGHGSTDGELILENDQGRSVAVGGSALKNILQPFSSTLECVILNAAYSASLAEELTESIRYVVATPSAMSDSASMAFSAGFYQALGNGLSIKASFQYGRSLIELEGFLEESAPVLFSKHEE